MSKTVQLKRGNANVSASYVGAVGEITVNTTDYTLNIHDGVTPGGYVVTGINGGNIGNISFNDQTISGLNSNADITLDSGNANLDIQGNTVVTGNITADYYIGNGTLLTGLYSNADVVSLLNNFGNPISTTSNVTAAYFVGNGANLTGVNVTTFANVRVNNQTIFSINEPTEALVVGRGDGLGNVLIQGNVFVYDATIQTARLGNVIANGSVVSLGNISVNVVTGGRFIGDVVTLRYSNVVTGFCFTSNDQQFLTNTGLLHREQSLANPNVSVLALSHDQPVAYFYSNTTTEMVGNLVVTTSNRPHGAFANAFVAVYSNVNSYSQLIKQNTNEGTEVSSDFVATSNNGTDTTFYVDLGIAGNLHADSEFFGDTTSFNDAYLYITGYDQAGPSTGNIGNLIIGSTNGVVKTFIGNTAEANVVTVVNNTGLLPGANVVYSLGSSTRQWKDLWVSNNTIYLGGVSLSVSADGNLLVNGNAVTGGGNANVSLGNFVFSANSLLNFNGGSYTNGDLSHGHTAAVILPLNGSNNSIQILNTYSNVTVSSGSNSSITGTWTFDNLGRLLLPTSGKIVGVTANNNGYLTWEGSSSGDGLGFTTMTLVPDDTVSSQVLVLDPTAPGHIHLRAPGIGGNIEQPAANIFLGSETTSFEITAQYGVSPEARIHSGNNTWYFDANGSLSTPGNVTVNDTLFIVGSIQPFGASPAPYLSGFSSISTVISGNPNEGNITAHNYLIANGGIITSGNITANYLIGNGSELTSVNAATVDILNTNGLGTTFYPTFVENRTDGQILRADVDLSYRTDTNTLTTNAISSSGNISATYFIGNGALLTGIVAGSGNYGDSNVSTFLASLGSNSIVTTGNITGGNISSAAGKNIVLGNASSQIRQIGSNSLISLSGSITLTPDTAASALNGVIIGGSGYLLAPNGARNLTLNYNSDSGHVGLQANATVGSAGSGGVLNIAGTLVTGANAIVAGITNTVAFPNTTAKFSSNVDGYSQLLLQNKSNGTDATTDIVATANNGTDSIFFVDMGIAGNTYDNASPNNSLGTLLYANDSYLYAQGNTSANVGGNLVIGASTAGKVVKIFANGINSGSIVATFSNTGVDVTGNVTTTGNLTTGNIIGNVNGFTIGYRDIPQVTFTSNATLALTDAGKHYFSSNSANVITVPNNATVSFNIGAAISIVQQGTGNLTISPAGGVTMYLAGNSTSSSRLLGNYGMATLMKVGTDTWFINGTGLT